MGSYGVIKEALLVSVNVSGVAKVVQKLVPSTTNGGVQIPKENSGFSIHGLPFAVWSINRGGAFGFSELTEEGQLLVSVNVPGYGTKNFEGSTLIEDVIGIGECVKCRPLTHSPIQDDPNATYTHLCLVVESPGKVFAKSFG